ncbi:MAG: hypothetical protein RRA45_03320 [Saccharolobus sp.]|uniref:hypothetical protein n=1 Tax=Saccharolobus sp. TaxID=2100761 RepID=UPI0028CEA517|nr:hypothetical protein [Saccharolobus sp.]MDT7861233.1 hypothetical protein [Saccharolobus sp.]
MPIKYVCKNCGTVLHKFEKVGQDFYGVRTPSEIRSIYGGRCPKCGHELGVPSLNEIKISLKRRAVKVMLIE